LIRVYPNNNETLQYLNALYKESTLYDLDFWQPPTKIGAVVELTVGPRDAPVFLRDLEAKELHYTVTLNDLQQAIENEKSTPVFLHSESDGYSYDKYHSLDEIYEEMLRLRRKNPNIISLIDIGESHENRSLLVIKVGNIILVHGYDNGISIRRILDHIDFYILPVMNPDGYEYSRLKITIAQNRMWRKNRRPYNCKHQRFHSGCCTGVDLNRNFDWFWSSAGSSTDPCHDTYPGLKAFSEAETVAVRDYLQANKPEAFITLHSYSQMWLIPYGHRKRSYPQDYHTALRPLAEKAAEALLKTYGTKYQVGTGADLLYEASGGSHDWAKGSLQVRYAYLIELRPKSGTTGYGFLLPEREISATGLETFEAIKVVAEEMVEQFVEPSTKRRVRLSE
uniref:Peptidase_M14 domain-containing protein n=1 Tax=Angiostrongylus cantonensis TaxID=6313 RepID=A0A158P7T3_ANGCA